MSASLTASANSQTFKPSSLTFSQEAHTDDNVKSGVAEAEGLCPSLGTISQNGYPLTIEDVHVYVFFMIELHGSYLATLFTNDVGLIIL